MNSLGSVKRLSFKKFIGDVQLGEDDMFHTLVWDSRDPYRTQKLIGPHASVTEAARAFDKLVGSRKRVGYRAAKKMYRQEYKKYGRVRMISTA